VPQLFSGPCGSPLDPVQPPAAMLCLDSAAPPAASPLSVSSPGHDVSYVSIVQGVPRLHRSWAECAARVHGVSGARYKKVRTTAELLDFCKHHGVPPPPAK
jgi:hypothetical protein